MNLNINKTNLTIEDKTFKLNEIDFMLFCGKIRLYKNNGTIETIIGNYPKEDCKKLFTAIASAISSVNQNFLFCKPNKLVNLSNVKSVKEEDGNNM